MVTNGVRYEKKRIRDEILQKRLSLTEEERQAADAAMCRRLVSLASFRFAETLLMYAPIKGEPDLLGVCEAALRTGKRIAFPKCDPTTCTMTYYYVSSLADLTPGAYGILEPSTALEPYLPSMQKHDVCLVPAVCFDRHGYRVGYGKGYYDRFLSKFGGSTIGFTLHRFLFDSLPRGRYDRTVHLILTERGVITPQ